MKLINTNHSDLQLGQKVLDHSGVLSEIFNTGMDTTVEYSFETRGGKGEQFETKRLGLRFHLTMDKCSF